MPRRGADDPEIDVAAVIAEVTASFERYEEALVANDLTVLDELFWQDPRTVRVGIDDRQDGFEAIRAFRRARGRQTPPRNLRHTAVVSFDDRTAVVTTTFEPTDGSPAGRQSQTWVRFAEGWRIVAAHVSSAASANVKATDLEP